MGNDRENRINQILSAAFEVFVKKGYSKTTMDDIVVAEDKDKMVGQVTCPLSLAATPLARGARSPRSAPPHTPA